MMTPQDIREKTFEKAVFGGYDMGQVDDFMEAAASDLAALQKENGVLKGKMKVLVEKVEEYRANEDALRAAILSAQKMGNLIEKEAREKSEKMISDAMADAARITKEASLEVDVEKAKLEKARQSSAQFIENMNLLCRKQLDFLSKLNDTDFVRAAHIQTAQQSEPERAAAPAQEDDSREIHETVKSIEETVAKAASEPVGNVKPDVRAAAQLAQDDEPTRAFDFVSASADSRGASMDKTAQFSFDMLDK